MEAHPIPQNVTSFQFKLVGDMTLKQFMYLAIGVGLAYFIFVLFSRNFPYIAWPVAAISAGLGAAFAFLPVGSRPLDHWLSAFLKAIYSPTKRAWKKNGRSFKEDALFNSRLIMYLAGQTAPSTPLPSEPSIALFPQPMQPPAPLPSTLPTPAPAKEGAELPTQDELQKTVELARQAQQLQMKIIQSERTLSQIKDEAKKPSPIPVDYSQEVNKILRDLQTLVKQASVIKQELYKVQEPEAKPQQAPASAAISRAKVTVVVPSKPKATQLILTTFPNVINGVIRDNQNNYLEGVVAVIYDKEGLPVRALKTNKLGQFTGSTPLPNGTYTLELERESLTFDVLQIELTGGILPPLLITAK